MIMQTAIDTIYPVELNFGLSEEEIELAEKFVDWFTVNGHFFGIAGHMIVTGMPRQGKGLFASTFCWWLKRLFRGKHILSDEALKPAFGEYRMFTEDTFREDIDKMSELADEQTKKKRMTGTEEKKLVEQWITDDGQVELKHAILRLSEYRRYMYNRRPASIMNFLISTLITQWGHIDLLIIGDVQLAHDLDQYTCLPYVGYDVRCCWSTIYPNTVEAHMYRTTFNKARGELVPIGKPIPITIDGAKQRPELGIKDYDNKTGEPIYNSYFDLYYSKSPPQFKFGRRNLGGTL